MSIHCQCKAFHIDARGLRRKIAEEREVGSRDKGKAIVCFSVRGQPGLTISSKGGKGDETNHRRIQKVILKVWEKELEVNLKKSKMVIFGKRAGIKKKEERKWGE